MLLRHDGAWRKKVLQGSQLAVGERNIWYQFPVMVRNDMFYGVDSIQLIDPLVSSYCKEY